MISIIVEGIETPLSAIGAVSGHDGWGMAPMKRIRERGPMQHGATPVDFRLEPRVGMFAFKLPEQNFEGMYTARQRVLSYFPPDRTIVVRWSLPYGVRQFDCLYESDLGLPWQVEHWAVQQCVVSLIADDPTCYDPEGRSITFSLGAGADAFEVPLAVPIAVGTSTIDQSFVVQYPGNWLAYPQIRINGPITDCVIEQQTTGEKLDFTGVTISAGEWLDIDLRYGYKTITDQDGNSQLASLTEDSDLVTFHLAPVRHGEPARANSIRVTGSGANEATRVDLSYFVRYTGI